MLPEHWNAAALILRFVHRKDVYDQMPRDQSRVSKFHCHIVASPAEDVVALFFKPFPQYPPIHCSKDLLVYRICDSLANGRRTHRAKLRSRIFTEANAEFCIRLVA